MNRLKELRKKNNVTLQKLADYLHIANSAISQYENEKREPSFDIVSKIADYFNVSIDYLLGRENTEPILENYFRDFPGNPVVKTLCFCFRGLRFDSWSEN